VSFPSSSRPRRRYGRERFQRQECRNHSAPQPRHDDVKRAVALPLPGGSTSLVGGHRTAASCRNKYRPSRGKLARLTGFSLCGISCIREPPSPGNRLASGSVFVEGSTNTARAELAEPTRLHPAPPWRDVRFWRNRTKGIGVCAGEVHWITVAADYHDRFRLRWALRPGVVRDTYGSVQYGAIVSATAPAPPPGTTRIRMASTACIFERRVRVPRDPTAGRGHSGTLDTLGVNVTAPRTLDFRLQLIATPARRGSERLGNAHGWPSTFP